MASKKNEKEISNYVIFQFYNFQGFSGIISVELILMDNGQNIF